MRLRKGYHKFSQFASTSAECRIHKCPPLIRFVVTLAALISLASTAFADTYRIQPGDELLIVVLGQPEYSQPLSVRSDGMISYFGQDLSVVDKTPEEISELIHGLLSKQGRLKEPIIMVSPRPRGKEIFVGGAVKLPGRYPLLLQDEIGLYRVITIAGGFLEESADRKHIQVVGQDGTVEEHDLSPGKPYELITVGHGDLVFVLSLGVVDVQGQAKQPGQLRISGRIRIDEALARMGGYTEEANLSELVIMRADGEKIVVDISEQFWRTEYGDNDNYHLKNGDTLYVPNANRIEPIYVLGYVRNPGRHKVRGPIAPLKAIALAGGSEKEANLKKVKITRKDETVQEVNLNAPEALEILLHPGDILEIPKGRQINWPVVLSFITVASTLVNILTR